MNNTHKIHLYKISWNCSLFSVLKYKNSEVKSLDCKKPCNCLWTCLGLPSKSTSTERKTLPFTEKSARNKVPMVSTPLWTSSKNVFHRTTPERMEGLAVTNTTDFQRGSCKFCFMKFLEVWTQVQVPISDLVCSFNL